MTQGMPGLRGEILLGALALMPGTTSSAQADSFAGFLSQGRLMFDSRYRYENVEQHGFANDADANTVRERLGVESAAVWNVQALAEIQATQHLSNNFDDTINGHTAYPAVPDPETFELNRLQLSYTGAPDTVATLGRQLINLDDQRFIGASAFRQNEQTFDAVQFNYNGVSNLAITYAYADRVNRVFGDRSPVGHFNGNIYLFNIAYDIVGFGKLTSFAYLLDIDNSPALSTATYGLQFAGAHHLNDEIGLHYIASYARQTDYATNPSRLALDYWRLEGGIDYAGWSLIGGSETLGSNGVIGFSTPLATLHAFQGDADVFITTPPQGTADRYAKLGYQMDFEALGAARQLTLAAAYHDFTTARGQAALGHELDFDAVIKMGVHWPLDLAHAIYDDTPNFASRNKTWLSLTFNY
jgi:hypothetical protein